MVFESYGLCILPTIQSLKGQLLWNVKPLRWNLLNDPSLADTTFAKSGSRGN
jgi:hypothetical protein